MLRQFFNALFLLYPNCRQAAHLISERTEHELSPLDRLKSRLHLFKTPSYVFLESVVKNESKLLPV